MHADTFLREVAQIAEALDSEKVDLLAEMLADTRLRCGRVFIVGLGGSLPNAEHMAADLRKLCEIEAYAPNIAEMSAYTNDEGAEHAFDGYLRWLTAKDALVVLSVGGGTDTVSKAISVAVDAARAAGAWIFSIVGPNGGHAAAHADVALKVPAPSARVTPHTEAFQAVVWHCIVSHPRLQRRATKW